MQVVWGERGGVQVWGCGGVWAGQEVVELWQCWALVEGRGGDPGFCQQVGDGVSSMSEGTQGSSGFGVRTIGSGRVELAEPSSSSKAGPQGNVPLAVCWLWDRRGCGTERAGWAWVAVRFLLFREPCNLPPRATARQCWAASLCRRKDGCWLQGSC